MNKLAFCHGSDCHCIAKTLTQLNENDLEHDNGGDHFIRYGVSMATAQVLAAAAA